jgi:tRNA threonylcarbamoyladenosine biosynthesis protein TsaE
MESFLKKKYKKKGRYISAGAAKTAAYGRSFAGFLKAGDVVGLKGELGAGKTRFIKGVAGRFGIRTGDIISPTFNIVKEHKAGNLMIYHFDFYRLKSGEELDKIGYRDYIADERAITLIEWPDRIREVWKGLDWVVKIEHKGNNKREIMIFESGNRRPETGVKKNRKHEIGNRNKTHTKRK